MAINNVPFKPTTSSKTKKVEVVQCEGVGEITIYSHTSNRLHGKFVAVLDDDNWITARTLDEAREYASNPDHFDYAFPNHKK